jgi:predicted  nucleic acid-binding Zn-ribbon protein
MAPDEVEPPMPIKTADELIEEARNRFAELDRKLAKLQRSRSRNSASVKRAREERDRSRMELLELIELAEMPVEFMGWA